MKTIKHAATLFYYDGPQVFEARDAIGGHYIAVMIESIQTYDRYLVAGVAPESLRQFRSGTIDLRSLLLERSEDDWYLCTVDQGLEQLLAIDLQPTPLAEVNFLPEAGFLLHDRPAGTETLFAARERNNLVLEISMEPPEAAAEHRIHIGTLVGLLSHLQVVVKHAYTSAIKDLAPAVRKTIDKLDGHLFDVVVPAAEGSFKVVLEATRTSDLFGQSELIRALQRIDELFEKVGDPHQVLELLKARRGHLSGAYLKLLHFLVKSKSGLRYEWADPSFTHTRRGAVTEAELGPLIELLSGVSNLAAETIILTGALEKADVVSGAWRLATEDGNFSGKVKEGGPSLSGLKLESIYKFTCVEEIEEITGTGRENKTLYLMEHEPDRI